MLKMLILVCSSSVSPPDCQVDTALDVIHGPQVRSVFECGMASQSMAAQSTILRNAPKEYIKVKCSPVKMAETEPRSPDATTALRR